MTWMQFVCWSLGPEHLHLSREYKWILDDLKISCTLFWARQNMLFLELYIKDSHSRFSQKFTS